MLQKPYPELDDLLEMTGEAGHHLAEIEASEGAAGNISVCMRWSVEPRTRFPVLQEIRWPQAMPELAGAIFLVSGSGRRLREIIDEPTVGFIPFCIPGSDELMAGNIEALRTHCVVIWTKHGVMARSDVSVKRAADRREIRVSEPVCWRNW